MTEDHSLVAGMVKEGQISREEAKGHHLRHVIDRALGVQRQVVIDINIFSYHGEPLLLCIDGLIDLVEDNEMQDILSNFSQPQKACDQLVEMANEKGGKDNITVVIIKKT